MPDTALWVEWTYQSGGGSSTVFPDGCRDLILTETGSFTTELDLTPRLTNLRSGARLTGFRLRPGVALAPSDTRPDGSDIDAIRRFLETHAIRDPATEDIITALSGGDDDPATLGHSDAARRSLQRRFQRRGLPPPQVWRGLARARRAAMLLNGPLPLAEIALICGYSDQAHLTRECRRWFGAPPARLRKDRTALTILSQPGLGNWTGEQISIR